MPNPDETAQRIAKRILKGKKILQSFEETLIESLVVSGKTLNQWARDLNVTMPKDLDDHEGLYKALSDVAQNTQIAIYLLGLYEAQATSTSSYSEKQFATAYVATMGEHGQKISADKLKQLTLLNEDVDNSILTTQTAILLRDFFKKIVKGLEAVRKSLESQININRQKYWLEHQRSPE